MRFCLICNYISRIDEGLQNEFIRLRFNQLPKNDIILFLSSISKSEKLDLTDKSLYLIQTLYKSDIRSMINFMQSNQNVKPEDFNIIDNELWENLYVQIKNNTPINMLVANINNISIKYNIDKKNIIKDFLNYIIRNKTSEIDILTNMSKYLFFIENIMHFEDCKNSCYINYSISRLYALFNK